MFNVEILADSLSPQRDRLTTMKITFPRIILAEFNTHRMFSRNSASSRAIPFKKMVQMVKENPFIPLAWQKHHSGMQGNEYISTKEGIYVCNKGWLEARDNAVKQAMWMNSCNVTKQLCNRLLEPFMWHTVIVTATEWKNFFALRCPKYYYEPENKYFKSKKDYSNYWFECFGSGIEEAIEGDPVLWWLNINHSQAEIHIQAIAELMWDAMNESTPLQLEAGEWHIPNFGHEWDNDKLLEIIKGDLSKRTETRIKISTAYNARISYKTLGDNPKIDYKADIRLHDMLLESKHFSPFEHCARAMSDEEYNSFVKGQLDINYADMVSDDYKTIDGGSQLTSFGWCKNYRGFISYRHLIDN